MKRKKLILSLGLVLIIVIIGSIFNKDSNKLPSKRPKVDIIINNKSYDTALGEGNWFDKELGGNSYIIPIEDYLKQCEIIEVKANEKIKFDISYSKNIGKTLLSSIDIEELPSEKRTDLEENIYEFKSPSKAGDYYYTYRVTWDETHDLLYIFKIRVVE